MLKVFPKLLYLYSVVVQGFINICINKKNKSHVLMFHQVSADDPEQFNVGIEKFKEIIDWHIKNGYAFVSINDLGNTKAVNNQKACIVTFDDGYKSILDAVNYLRLMKIPYCIYCTTGFLDKEQYLSRQELYELSKDKLCTIGNHTVTHPKARFISKKELKEEVLTCNKELKQVVGYEPMHFAFPYGSIYSVSLANILAIKRLGLFKSIATTLYCKLNINSKGSVIGRYDASRKDILEIL